MSGGKQDDQQKWAMMGVSQEGGPMVMEWVPHGLGEEDYGLFWGFDRENFGSEGESRCGEASRDHHAWVTASAGRVGVVVVPLFEAGELVAMHFVRPVGEA